MTFVVTEACVDTKDRSCIQVCPVDCLYEGNRMMYIDANQCINCGACEPVCPVNAIRFEDELEGEDEQYLRLNELFFEEVQPPKGGRRLGRFDHDVAAVAALPEK